MDVKQAIKTAKAYLEDVYQGEGILEVGLEEIRYDDFNHAWFITLGFVRPGRAPANAMDFTLMAVAAARTYKTIKVDDASGRALSMENRTPYD